MKMPGGDGTGPRGLGSRTGRGLGYCNGYPTPGYMTPGPGLGLGRGGLGRGMAWRRGGLGGGWGRGRGGWGRGADWWAGPPVYAPGYAPVGVPVPPPAPTKQQVIDDLEATRNYFESQLGEIKAEIDRVKKEDWGTQNPENL